MKKRIITVITVLIILLSAGYTAINEDSVEPKTTVETSIDITEDIPKYTGEPYVEINGNVPYFTDEDRNVFAPGYEYYGGLDDLGRCTVAEACVGYETAPLEGEERGSIGMIRPSGWHTIKYDCVSGKYLYNRSHLIGWQLTTENANEMNLITGTRSFNVDGMLPFEDMVAEYFKTTQNHVMYRVTPIFEGDNLLASGVLMEAQSLEDNELSFCVYVFNVQDGVEIDYATGESRLAE